MPATALALFAALLLLPRGAQAQELSASSVRIAATTQDALSDASGFSVGGSIAPSTWVRFEGSYTEVGNALARTDRLCGFYEPPANCNTEQVIDDLTLRTLRVAYAPEFDPLHWLRLRLKAGLSVSQVQSESETESMRFTNLQHPQTGHVGGGLAAELALQPLRALPLSLTVGGTSHWINFDGCSPHDFYYAPFCGVDRFNELQLGATYRFAG